MVTTVDTFGAKPPDVTFSSRDMGIIDNFVPEDVRSSEKLNRMLNVVFDCIRNEKSAVQQVSAS
jgi:hypothetical protein